MDARMTRREFIAQLAVASAAVSGASLLGTRLYAAPEPVIAVAANASPGVLARQAVAALGGMRHFVKPGQRVAVKPNASYACAPEQAATTHPDIVAEVVKMCYEAEAASVIVLDSPVDPAGQAFELSGIREAAEREKAEVILHSSFYRPVAVPQGRVLNAKPVYVSKDALTADVLISVPIAKVHSETGYSIGLKSLMGLVRSRQVWHTSGSLDQCIADFATVIRPHLTIVDAYRILLTNGPKGPGETRDVGRVIAGTDPVAVDAYAVTLFGTTATHVPHLAAAARLGVGQIDLKQIKVKQASV